MAKNELKTDLETVSKTLSPQGEILTQVICESLKIDTNAGREFVHYALANALLMNRKQHDYGPGNIAKFGSAGCIMRMSDKLERLCNLFNIKGRKKVALNESIADSLRDLSNYGIIAQMCDDGKWPKE